MRQYFEDTRTAFPDQRNELIALHHTDGVIVEFDPRGTHQGPPRGIPATGEEFTCRTVATILGQLGLIQPGPSLQGTDTAQTKREEDR